MVFISALFAPLSAYAADSYNYSWIDKYHIDLTSSRVSGTIHFSDAIAIEFGDGNPLAGSYTAIFKDISGCTMAESIKPSSNGVVADINSDPSVENPGASGSCPESIWKLYPTNIPIHNPGNRTPPVSTKVVVTSLPVSDIATKSDLSGAPATDTISITDVDNNTVMAVATPDYVWDDTKKVLSYTSTLTVPIKDSATGKTANYNACSTLGATCSDNFQVVAGQTKNITITGKNTAFAGSGITGCSAGSLSWLFCGAIDALRDVVEPMKRVVEGLLSITPIAVDTTNGLYKVWSNFRNLADVILIVVFFFVIFGTSLGVDNYTVKRVLPRLIAAAILIQFSYLIMGLLNDIVNVVSGGLGQLAVNALGGNNLGTAGTNPLLMGIGTALTFITGAAVVGLAAVAGAAIPIFMAMLSAVIGLITTVITLEIRQMILYGLIAISPIAIALWILPNTQNYYKMWQKQFVGLLLMYPLVVLLFVTADLFTVVISNNTSSNDFTKLLASLAPIAVLFLVPSTYKFGGSLFNYGQKFTSKLGGSLNKQAQNNIAKPWAESAKASAIQSLGANGSTGAMGRLRASRAGFNMLTAGSAANQRKIQSAIDKDLKERVEQERGVIKAKLKDKGLSATSTEGVAQIVEGFKGAKNTAQKTAHLRELASTENGRHALAGMRKDMGLDYSEAELAQQTPAKQQEIARNKETWSEAMFGDKDTQAMVKKTAPDLLLGSKGFDNMKLGDADAKTTSRFTADLKQRKADMLDSSHKAADLENRRRNGEAITEEEIKQANNEAIVSRARFAAAEGVINKAARNPEPMNAAIVKQLNDDLKLSEGTGDSILTAAAMENLKRNYDLPSGAYTPPPPKNN
jgi:hypothetical protein